MTSGPKLKKLLQIVSVLQLLAVPILIAEAFLLMTQPMFKRDPMTPTTANIMAVFFIFSGIFITLFIIIVRNKLNKERDKGGMITQSEFILRLLLLFLYTTPAVCGFLIFLMTMNMNYLYILGSVSLLLSAVFFPRGEFPEKPE